MLQAIAALVFSYLLGSVPSGLWLGLWFRGVDIRLHGSRNIGATNTLRVLGTSMGAAALAADVAKGLAATLLVARISPWAYAPLLCGAASILGHTASVFLGFRGGKGVATSAGVFLALCPIPTLIAGAAFAAVVAITRMVSAGSCTAALVLAASLYALPHPWATTPTYLLPEPWTPRIVVTLVAALVLVKHRGNIQRILKGQENKI